jgi:hypothetical protein
VLPDALSGPVYLVAHATGLPTIEALLQGHKLSIDLSGTITFGPTGQVNSTFAAVPDAPITSFVLDLPRGPHSALSSTKGVCGGPLTMATTIVGQSGARIEQATPIVVTDCPANTPNGKLKILRVRVKRAVATLLVQAPRTGTLIATGKGLRRASRSVKAGRVTLKVRLSKYGRSLRVRRHRAHRKLKLPVTLHLGSLKTKRTLTFK